MFVTLLQYLELVDFEIGHKYIFLFLIIISEGSCFTYYLLSYNRHYL